ncbi:putative 4-alpha-glucanotransferase DPE2 [Blattamonas nauphoetae]|uniref:4-alpha-glucanotransferase n=1 Tax=Blattamonas nauphoetae TaxID=2049346 RepID=A0ABQ9WSV9_9EUKA|nr:putative 4-alpha-glucanotransferase DPE2 [Blattamonas nauphoetae]
MPHATVLFSVRYEHTICGDSLLICGSLPELGNWDSEKAVTMSGFEGNWTAYVSIPIGTPFEYKYIYRSSTGQFWDHENHSRTIQIPVGEIIEIRDLWSLPPTDNERLRRTAFIKGVCQRRAHSQPPSFPDGSDSQNVTVLFETSVPLINNHETVHVVDSDGMKPLFDSTPSQPFSDSEHPIFTGVTSVPTTEFPFNYRFALSENDGNTFSEIENGNPHICLPPIPIMIEAADCQVWVLRNAVPTQIHITKAIDENIIKPLTCPHAKYLIIRSPEFRYPNSAHFKAAGLAIPVFSLRTEHSLGVGEFSDLPQMAEFCHRTGMHVLQILPITDTTVNFVHWRDSYPYSSVSSFALHPIYINIDSLTPIPHDIEEQLPKLRVELDLPHLDYEKTLSTKMSFLRQIFDFHVSKNIISSDDAFIQFQKDSSYWLPSYCCFKTLAEQFQTTNWQKWPADHTEASSVASRISQMSQPTDPQHSTFHFHEWVQYHLDKQLRQASSICADRYQVALKGDIPIGVDPNSADTWFFRDYFRTGTKSGAPPDAFAMFGQNWGFPTYNWEKIIEDDFSWFANRLKVMERSFSLFRIDHLLGFFRIWEIPSNCESGLHARFYPGTMVHKNDLPQWGLNHPIGLTRYTLPVISYEMLLDQFGIEEGRKVLGFFFQQAPHGWPGDICFRPEFATEEQIAQAVRKQRNVDDSSPPDVLRELDVYLKKFWVLTNSVCLYSYGDWVVPRFGMNKSLNWQKLPDSEKAALENMEKEYFNDWHKPTWWDSADQKFRLICKNTSMLVCGEDLGMVSNIVPPLMKLHHILGLRVQRMPQDESQAFSHPNNAEYETVVTTSTHDCPPLRAWWQMFNPKRTDYESFLQTPDGNLAWRKRQHYWEVFLGHRSLAPNVLPSSELGRILDMHVYSPSMLCILPYQDWTSIAQEDSEVVVEDVWDEVINEPDNRFHSWDYRMRCTLEKLNSKTNLIGEIRRKVEDSGRMKGH